jgi:ABC-type Mn2+/Zn2+ transport system permease subunit
VVAGLAASLQWDWPLGPAIVLMAAIGFILVKILDDVFSLPC